MNTQKLYDLTNLIGMIGDGEGLQMMLSIFLESTPNILNEMNDSFVNKDFENMARNAHKIKASLDMMKIDSLHDVIRQIDKHEKALANQGELASIIEKISAVLRQVFDQLKEEQSGKNQV